MASKTDSDFGAPFSPETGSALSHRKDQLDLAGQAILSLLEKAADAAEDNNRRAVETAQKLSTQLRAAEARIAELEAENQLCREMSERAEDGCAEFIRKSRKALSENVDATI